MRRPSRRAENHRMRLFAVVLLAVTGCDKSSIHGVVHGDDGKLVANASLWFVDTAHLDRTARRPGGCGTINPQRTVFSAADGAFAAELPFVPTQLTVSTNDELYEPLRLDVTSGVPSILVLHAIDWQFVDVRAVDA